MSGRIPQQFIDDLSDRLDIVDIIGSRVRLKKSGANYTACCPFHQEKTPSMYIYTDPGNQHYHCFGCGAHGGVVQFVQAFDGLTFPETIEQLARLAGLEVPRATQEFKPDPNKPIIDALEWARELYREQLRSHPQRQLALDYLARRGLNEDIIERYQIGFAPAGAALLSQTASPLQLKALLEARIVLEKDGRHFDLFHNRIIFPIRDRRGKTIAFGGRTLGNDRAKYINSPESPVFHKSSHLYGLFETLKVDRQIKQLVVVEGYMDVVSLAQFGIHYGVATLGTATNQENISHLLKQTQDVVFCFDGDRAGFEAARKALNNCLPLLADGMNIRFLMLPQGEDPDSLIRREGTEAFRQRLEQARPLSMFFFDLHSEGLNLDLPEHKAILKTRAEPQLGQISAPTLRSAMRDQLRALTDTFFARKQQFQKRRQQQEKFREARADVVLNLGLFICLALFYRPQQWPKFAPLLDMELEASDFRKAQAFVRYLKTHQIQDQLSLLQRLATDAQARTQFGDYFDGIELLPDADRAETEALASLANFEKMWRGERQAALVEKIKSFGSLTDEEMAELRRLTTAAATTARDN